MEDEGKYAILVVLVFGTLVRIWRTSWRTSWFYSFVVWNFEKYASSKIKNDSMAWLVLIWEMQSFWVLAMAYECFHTKVI